MWPTLVAFRSHAGPGRGDLGGGAGCLPSQSLSSGQDLCIPSPRTCQLEAESPKATESDVPWSLVTRELSAGQQNPHCTDTRWERNVGPTKPPKLWAHLSQQRTRPDKHMRPRHFTVR